MLKILLTISQLQLDLEELNSVVERLTRQRNIDFITLQKKRVETELVNLRAQLKAEQSKDKPASSPSQNNTASKRIECEITNYAWDQSDKFIKLFVTLDNAQEAGEENVVVTFTDNSIVARIANVQNKDHRFNINNLLFAIDVEKSYRKVKTNMVAIYAKKKQEGESWPFKQ